MILSVSAKSWAKQSALVVAAYISFLLVIFDSVKIGYCHERGRKDNPAMHIDDPAVSRFVFHPRKESGIHRFGGIPTETVSGGEKIGGYLHLHPESKTLILFFHGNGEIAGDYDDLARFYVACGASFWVVDYRGYGRSTGTPSYTHMFTDAEAIFHDVDKMERSNGRSFHRRLIMGRSLGSASAIYLASTHPDRVKGLILDSPFADGPALISRLGGPKVSTESIVGKDNGDLIKAVLAPCLILHGGQDWIIPIRDAETLYENCPSLKKKLIKIDAAGHNDLLVLGFDTYFKEIKGLIESTAP